jgi:hypothetical protein
MKKIILVLTIFLIPAMLRAEQETVSEKIESMLSWIESDSSYKGVELKMMLRGILEIATEEIQTAALEAATKTEKEVREILVPIIQQERDEKTIWMCIGIGAGTATVVLTIILIIGGIS